MGSRSGTTAGVAMASSSSSSQDSSARQRNQLLDVVGDHDPSQFGTDESGGPGGGVSFETEAHYDPRDETGAAALLGIKSVKLLAPTTNGWVASWDRDCMQKLLDSSSPSAHAAAVDAEALLALDRLTVAATVSFTLEKRGVGCFAVANGPWLPTADHHTKAVQASHALGSRPPQQVESVPAADGNDDFDSFAASRGDPRGDGAATATSSAMKAGATSSAHDAQATSSSSVAALSSAIVSELLVEMDLLASNSANAASSTIGIADTTTMNGTPQLAGGTISDILCLHPDVIAAAVGPSLCIYARGGGVNGNATANSLKNVSPPAPVSPASPAVPPPSHETSPSRLGKQSMTAGESLPPPPPPKSGWTLLAKVDTGLDIATLHATRRQIACVSKEYAQITIVDIADLRQYMLMQTAFKASAATVAGRQSVTQSLPQCRVLRRIVADGVVVAASPRWLAYCGATPRAAGTKSPNSGAAGGPPPLCALPPAAADLSAVPNRTAEEPSNDITSASGPYPQSGAHVQTTVSVNKSESAVEQVAKSVLDGIGMAKKAIWGTSPALRASDDPGGANSQQRDASHLGVVAVTDCGSANASTDIASFVAHNHALQCLAFDPSGSLLATASTQGTSINVFQILSWPEGGGTVRDVVAGLAARTSPEPISGGGATSTIRTSVVLLYRLARGMTISTVTSIAFHPTCSLAAVGTSLGTLHFYALPAIVAKPKAGGGSVRSTTTAARGPSLPGSGVGYYPRPFVHPDYADAHVAPTVVASCRARSAPSSEPVNPVAFFPSVMPVRGGAWPCVSISQATGSVSQFLVALDGSSLSCLGTVKVVEFGPPAPAVVGRWATAALSARGSSPLQTGGVVAPDATLAPGSDEHTRALHADWRARMDLRTHQKHSRLTLRLVAPSTLTSGEAAAVDSVGQQKGRKHQKGGATASSASPAGPTDRRHATAAMPASILPPRILAVKPCDIEEWEDIDAYAE